MHQPCLLFPLGFRNNPKPINKIISVAKNDIGICIIFASFSILTGLNIAIKPNINNKLHKLLPTAFPIIKSPAPLPAEFIVIIISGADVPRAIMLKPISISGI